MPTWIAKAAKVVTKAIRKITEAKTALNKVTRPGSAIKRKAKRSLWEAVKTAIFGEDIPDKLKEAHKVTTTIENPKKKIEHEIRKGVKSAINNTIEREKEGEKVENDTKKSISLLNILKTYPWTFKGIWDAQNPNSPVTPDGIAKMIYSYEYIENIIEASIHKHGDKATFDVLISWAVNGSSGMDALKRLVSATYDSYFNTYFNDPSVGRERYQQALDSLADALGVSRVEAVF